MDNLGQIVKYHRKSQKMTLESLAKGICSVSYLSKIENHFTKCSDEVAQLLLNKLGVYEETLIDQQEEHSIQDQMNSWYEDMLDANSQQARSKYNLLQAKIIDISNINIKKLYRLFEFRFFLLERDYTRLLAKHKELKEISITFNIKQQFYYFKFLGMYEYMYGKQSQAQKWYQEAKEILDNNCRLITIEHNGQEKGDLWFLIALNDYRLSNYNLSIHNTQKAIDIFNELFNWKRSIECRIMLGLAYKQINQFIQSKKQFELAIYASNQLNDSSIKGIIYQNLGNLFMKMGELTQSLDWFIKSFEHKESASNKAKVFSIVSIIEVHDKLTNYPEMNEWIQKGLNLIEKSNEPEYLSMYYILYFFKYKNEGKQAEMEELLINKAIPHFTEHEQYHYTYKYADFLSAHLSKQQKYKQAYYYSTISNSSLKKIAKVND